MGVHSQISKEKTDMILADIKANIPYELAAEGADICEKTLYNWINQGIADRIAGHDTEHRHFLQAIKRAEIDKIRSLAANIEYGADKWQSSAWLLERRWRKYFGADAGIIQELQAAFEEFKAAQRGNVPHETKELE